MRRARLFPLLLAAVLVAGQAPAGQGKGQSPPAKAADQSGGMPTKAELQVRVEKFLRKVFAWGSSFEVKVGEPVDSALPGFYQVTVEVRVGGDSDTAIMYISKDGRHLIRGDVLDTSVDPYAENRRLMNLDSSPSHGPTNARVVVVEYSDFQCPHCRQLHEALLQIEPLYPKVRFVSKHYPLSQIHPWAETAHLAAECAFRSSPEAYWKVHGAIFDQQGLINTENAYQKMIEISRNAGLDADTIKACMADPATKAAIERDLKEGQALHVANTPTVFVNGRRIVGGDPGVIRQYIDYELAATGSKP